MQAGGQRFDPAYLHQRMTPQDTARKRFEKTKTQVDAVEESAKPDDRDGVLQNG